MVLVVACVSAVVIFAAVSADGRTMPAPRLHKHTANVSPWPTADEDEEYHQRWFRTMFRCNKDCFDRIEAMITAHWDPRLIPAQNSKFKIHDRVAVALHYLTHKCTMFEAAAMFGMSKRVVCKYIWEVVDILNSIVDEWVYFPKRRDDIEWDEIMSNFEKTAKFPGVCGAMDGTLIEVERPADFEGFYCRKGFPGFNVLAIVDHRKKFRYFVIKPGSMNDQGVLNSSSLQLNMDSLLPPNGHFIADAGFKLTTKVLVPYSIKNGMARDEQKYNYYHSATRMTVEMAFGLLKNRFQRLRAPLNQKSVDHSAQLLVACMVLHNIFVSWNDEPVAAADASAPAVIAPAVIVPDPVEADVGTGGSAIQIFKRLAKAKRDNLKVHICRKNSTDPAVI